MANLTLRYVLCDVFTDRPLDGTALAVFTNASGASDAQMQRLARELGFAETAFVLPPKEGGHARLRVFSPAREVSRVRHSAIGAAAVIGGVMEAVSVRLELEAGVTPVALTREGARVTGGAMSLPLPERVSFGRGAELRAALGLDDRGAEVGAYLDEARRLVVPLSSGDALRRIEPDLGRLGELADASIVACAKIADRVETRVVSAGTGAVGAPATGALAVAAAAHLHALGSLAVDEEVCIVRDDGGGRPAEIFVRLGGEGAAASRVEIGGGVQVVARGEFRIPPG